MRGHYLLTACLLAPLLGGCIVKTAADVVTAPVRVAGKAVDLATTSQSERDEKRGRELRKQEEQLGKIEWRYREEHAACAEGSEQSCHDARASWAEMEALRQTLPPPPPPESQRH